MPDAAALPIVQIVHQPGVIDLGWGHPDPALLPVEGLRHAAAAALDRYGAAALAYGNQQGPGPLLRWLIASIGAREGRTPAADEVIVTGGISHALDQVCTLLTRPGDTVLVEQPTYHLAVRILREHPLDLVAIPSDTGGLRPEAVADVIAALRREGRMPRLLYTVPTFNNPTGVSLSAERRRALIDVATAAGLTIVEDDAYRELAYDGPVPPSLWSLAPTGTVIRLGSFAKAVAPGLRLGFLTADAATIERIRGGGVLDSGGGINHFTANTVAAFCEDGGFVAQGQHLRAAYRSRRDALAAALAEHLPPDCEWMLPAGGFFIWVRLPEGRDATALLSSAFAAGVGYAPGQRFHLDDDGGRFMRLAFGLYPEVELTEAARRLGMVLRTG
jgi:DNA-binding transcriptional MocR family regulator